MAANVGIIIASLVISVARGDLNPANAYHVTTTEDQPGLYYERVAPLRLQHVDWRVTVFIDVQKFVADFPTEEKQFAGMLTRCEEVITKLLNETNPMEKCKDFLNSDYLFSRLERAKLLAYELLTISHDTSVSKPEEGSEFRTIKKRSVPLGFIGSLSKSLFGTMNEEDAEYINTQIDQLFSDQANLTQLIGKQMHIVRSKLQDLHDQHLVETKRVELMGKQINELDKTLGDVTGKTAQMILRSELVDYARRIELKVDRYLEASAHYIQVITAARDGRYEPTILTTAQLLAVSREIRARTPEYEFPLSLEYLRGELLARVARTDLAFHSGRMLIIVHIPLLDRTSYNLYRMHPWPVPQVNTNYTGSAHITPATNYIAVSADRRTYFLADDMYIESCSHLEQKYICSMETPLHEISTSEQCEILMLIRPTLEAYRKCNVRIRPKHGAFWARLPSQGGWLFSLGEQETIHVLCPGLADMIIVLSGAGIFHLSPNCVGRTRSTSLTGIRTYESREQYVYTPAISLNVSIMVPNFMGVPKIQSALLLTGDDTGEEKQLINSESWKLQEDGESLFEIERRITEIGMHRRNKQRQHYLFLAGFSFQGILVVTAIMYFGRSQIWKMVICLCTRKQRRPHIKKKKLEEKTVTRDENLEAGQDSRASTHSCRLTSLRRGNKTSAIFKTDKGEVILACRTQRKDRTASPSLPMQCAETD